MRPAIALTLSASAAAHVAWKIRSYVQGSRDWADLFGDVAFGVAGALLAWACVLVR